MQVRALQIAVMGVDSSVAQALSKLAELNTDIPREIQCFTTLDIPAFCSSDIVVCDDTLFSHDFCSDDLAAPSSSACSAHSLNIPTSSVCLATEQLAALIAQRKKERGQRAGAVILLASLEFTQLWTPDEYCMIDALWNKPMDANRAGFELERTIQSVCCSMNIKQMQKTLDTLINATPDLVWFKNLDGAHLHVNDAFCSACGKTNEDIANQYDEYIWDLTPSEDESGEFSCTNSDMLTVEAGTTCAFDEQIKTQWGSRQYKIYKAPIFDDEHNPIATLGIAHDATDLGNYAIELNVLMNALPFAAIIEDTEKRIINMNKRCEEYFHVDKDMLLGLSIKEWRDYLFGDDAPNHEDNEDEFTVTIDGAKRIIDLDKTIIRDMFDNVTGRLRIYRDVTEEREIEQRIELASRTDMLTGLYNRRHFYQSLEAFEGKPITLIAFDLDDFKSINDNFGHAAGDEALVTMARILQREFPDATVIRWGGDEFLVAITEKQAKSAVRARVNSLLDALPFETDGMDVPWRLRGSAGVATDECLTDIDELVRCSDDALYRAKNAGKNRCFVHRDRDD